MQSVTDPPYFVTPRSATPFDVLSTIHDSQFVILVKEPVFQLVIHKRVHVEMWNLNQDREGNEIYDCILY